MNHLQFREELAKVTLFFQTFRQFPIAEPYLHPPICRIEDRYEVSLARRAILAKIRTFFHGWTEIDMLWRVQRWNNTVKMIAVGAHKSLI